MLLTPTDARRQDRVAGYVSAGLIVAIWAGFSLMSRWSARGGEGVRLTPWDLGAIRFGLAGVIAAGLWLAGYGRGLPFWRGMWIGALAGAGFALPSFAGFSMAPAAHGALVLSGTLPFLVAGGMWLVYREPWGRARTISLVLLLVGFVLFGTEAYVHQAAPAGAWRGDVCFLAGSASWAAYTVLARRWAPGAIQTIVAVGLWCGAAFVPLWWLALPSRLMSAPLGEVAAQMLFQGVVATLLSIWLYVRALAALGPARLTTITALVPGTAAVLAVPLLGEGLGPLSLAGLAVVGAAVVVGVGAGAPRARAAGA